jgi:copper chaperone
MLKSYRVVGMTCQGCVNALTRAIQRRVPDAKVTVDLPKNVVAVEASALTDDAIRTAVTDAGFTYTGIAA